MAKRSRTTTSKGIEQKTKKGIGQGSASDYKPWITVHDVPSYGLKSRVKGWKNGRVHHFLSQLESWCYYALDWASDVIDFREQYPLDFEETLDLSNRFGIKHPIDTSTKEPTVMTTDFLVEIDADGITKQIALSIKPQKALSSKRTIEKLALESIYWREKGVDWYLITEKEIPILLAKNIEWIHSAKDLSESPQISFRELAQIEDVLFQNISGVNAPLSKLALEVDDRLGFEVGTSLWVVRHLIANRIWLVDMKQEINPSNPLIILKRLGLSKEAGMV